MRIASVEMDKRILKALGDDNLVIFAGAGVSRGTPSNLPDFKELTEMIADGTAYKASSPWDQFLGFLECKGINVKKRARDLLSVQDSIPNDLHRNLISLFRSVDKVRIITTNFDHHFQDAAIELFKAQPKMYFAPALPRGNNFYGIIHVHGSIDQYNDLVLTDADFGKAYLTEGWARRFLVNVFQNYTVLFVGYSYDDTVMRYLSRALPGNNEMKRFVLIEKSSKVEKLEYWNNMGIMPLGFSLGRGKNKYRNLYRCIEELAKRSNYKVFDWQNRISEICKGAPPTDEEVIGELEQALSEEYTTRFFTKVARDIKWPKWMDDHKYLEGLFCDRKLNNKEEILATWLVEKYAIEYPGVIINIIAKNGFYINSSLWFLLVRELGNKAISISESILSKWIVIILECTPQKFNLMWLVLLAERCNEESTAYLALKIFLFLSDRQLILKPGIKWSEDKNDQYNQHDIEVELRADHWSLNKVWEECLKPHLVSIHHLLIIGVIKHFEKMYSDLKSWNKASTKWDMCCLTRLAIEPHMQDKHPRPMDVLIDAVRDTLEWLSSYSPILLKSWTEILIKTEIPILRRLAIHSISVNLGITPDEKLLWLTDRVKLNSLPEHHEIYCLLQLFYPYASNKTRKRIVNEITSYKMSGTEERTAEEWTARMQFDLLSWLKKANPDCPYAKRSLLPLVKRYPEWKVREHAEFTIWHGPFDWVTPKSPWDADELIAINPKEIIDDLLTFEGKSFDGPDRYGLIAALKDACKNNIDWAFGLIQVLIDNSKWSNDLWPSIFNGILEGDMSEESYRKIITQVARSELYSNYSYYIACLLLYLVRNEGRTYAFSLMDNANIIALELWEKIDEKSYHNEIRDWLEYAINDTAGTITEYWLHSLSLLVKNKENNEQDIPAYYKSLFEIIIKDPFVKGGLGRSLLVSQTVFLFSLDKKWVREFIIPLFSHVDHDLFKQAWHGFLAWGNLYSSLAEELLPSFISAVMRLDFDLPDHTERFIEFYSSLAIYFVENPIKKLIPEFLKNVSLNDKVRFASHIGYMLRQINTETKIEIWSRWLRKYWEGRLNGIPVPLENQEVAEMLEWLPLLDNNFPEAVSLAVKKRVKIENAFFIEEFKDGDLIDKYQNEFAILLIYLCDCMESYFRMDLASLAKRLNEIPLELKLQLDEALARIGAI